MKGLIVAFVMAFVAMTAPAFAAPEPATGPIIELNRATAEELQSLPGIGLKKAEAIIAQREKRPFTRVTQLLLVKGIGQKTLTRLKPRLAVRPLGPVVVMPRASSQPHAAPSTPEPKGTAEQPEPAAE